MKLKTALIAATAFAMQACGGEPMSHDPEARTSVEAQELILHEFDAAGDEIRISQMTGSDGQEVIMLRDQGPSDRPLVIDSLVAQRGALTLLEVYKALGPAGTEPDSRLLLLHDAEVTALGRTDRAVLDVTLDEARVEKISPSQCSSYAWPNPPSGKVWLNYSYKDNVSGFNYACVDGDCSFMTAYYTASHVCNDSNATIQERNAYDFDSTNPWNVTAWGDLAPGQHAGWYMPAGSLRRYSADGNSASGKNYHLRSAAMAGHGGS